MTYIEQKKVTFLIDRRFHKEILFGNGFKNSIYEVLGAEDLVKAVFRQKIKLKS